MDFEDFANILIGLNSPDSDQNQLHEVLMQFREENYPLFISYNLQILHTLSDFNLSSFVITIIFNEIKTRKIFEDEELEAAFLESFLQCIPNIYQSSNFLDHIKMIVSTTLSLIAIKRYQESSDTQIQQFIIQIFESNNIEFETLTINSIMETIVGCDDLGGFMENIISEFLVMPLQKETSYIPRCKLFFAVAINSPENEQLSQLFDSMYLQTEIPDLYLRDFLNVIIAFSEKHGEFFQPHISTFIPQLCEIAANAENDNEKRNLALFVFSSLCKCAPRMCQVMSEFYEPVVECIIQITSEVTEETPIEYDANNTEPCLIARDVLQSIGSHIGDPCAAFVHVDEICTQAIEKVSEEYGTKYDPGQAMLHIPWQLAYAITVSYCKLLVPAISTLFVKNVDYITPDYSDIIGITQKFIPLLSSNETPTILRVEILDLYSHLARSLLSHFLNGTIEFLLPLIKELIVNEEDQYVQYAAAQTLADYFNLLPNYLINFFPDAYEEILEITNQSPTYVYKSLIKTLTYFTLLRRDFIPQINTYFSALISIYKVTDEDDLDLKMFIILSFCKTYSTFSEMPEMNAISETNEISYNQFLEHCLHKFLTDLIQIGQAYQIDEYSNEDYYKTIYSLMSQLSESVSQIAESFLPKAMEKASEDIQIDQIQKLEVNELSNLYVEIEETQINYRNFALKSDIESINNALAMMVLIQCCLKLEIRPFVQDIVEISQKWILNVFQIEEIKKSAWKNLDTLIVIFKNEPDIENLMCLLFDDFNETIESATMEIAYTVIPIMRHALKKEKNDWFDPERIAGSLAKLDSFTDKAMNQLRLDIEKVDRYTGDHECKEESSTEQILYFSSRLYVAFLKKYTELTVSYMDENQYIEKLIELINSIDISNASQKPFINFAYEIITKYICVTQNLEMSLFWVQKLFEIAEECQDDPSTLAFKYMVKIFKYFDLPKEFVKELNQKFAEFIVKLHEIIYDEDEEQSSYFDWGLCAYAAFIMKYKDNINYDEAAELWCESFPIFKENQICDYCYAFLVQLLKERNSSAFSNENDRFSEIIQNLVRCIADEMMMHQTTRDEAKNVLKKIICDPIFGERAMLSISDSKEKFHFAAELWELGSSMLEEEDFDD